MKKHIAEDLPARKHPQAQMSAPSKPQGNKPSGGGDRPISGVEKTSEERVSQAASDIRLRSRRENKTLKTAHDEYMQHSKLSEAEKAEVRKKLFGGGTGMQAEDFEMVMKRSASDSMAKALYKVFVEKKTEVVDVDQLKNKLEEAANETAEYKKYKVRVTDKETKVTYVRYATREKINQLRAKGLEVEMTEHGTPYEGEKKRGEKTAEVLGKKAKRDYDGDGKLESPAKEHAGAVHNAIQRRRGLKPDGQDTSSIKEDTTSTEGQNAKKIDVMKSGEVNKVTVFPQDSVEPQIGSGVVRAGVEYDGPFLSEMAKSKAQQRFMGMVYARKKGAMKKGEASPEVEAAAKGMSKKEAKKFAKTKHKGLPEKVEEAVTGGSTPNLPAGVVKFVDELPQRIQQTLAGAKAKPATKPVKEAAECEMDEKPKLKKSEGGVEDPREIPTKINLAKNKMRAMGLKMSYEPEGEQIDELTRLDKEQGKQSGGSPDSAVQIGRAHV